MGAQGARSIESGNEWSTPPPVVAHAKRVLGIPEFDLDPAATKENAKALYFYDRAANGLRQNWWGFVWLNPPFSRSLTACEEPCPRTACEKRGQHLLEDQHGAVDFAKKAVFELEARKVDAIAWHGPVAPDTEWHAMLEPWAKQRFEFSGRLRYNGASQGGTFASSTTILTPQRRVSDWLPTRLVNLDNLGNWELGGQSFRPVNAYGKPFAIEAEVKRDD